MYPTDRVLYSKRRSRDIDVRRCCFIHAAEKPPLSSELPRKMSHNRTNIIDGHSRIATFSFYPFYVSPRPLSLASPQRCVFILLLSGRDSAKLLTPPGRGTHAPRSSYLPPGKTNVSPASGTTSRYVPRWPEVPANSKDLRFRSVYRLSMVLERWLALFSARYRWLPVSHTFRQRRGNPFARIIEDRSVSTFTSCQELLQTVDERSIVFDHYLDISDS